MDPGSQSYRRFLAGDESGLAEIIRDYGDGLILYLNSIVDRLSEAELLADAGDGVLHAQPLAFSAFLSDWKMNVQK